MIVCLCHRVSDRSIETEVRRGCRSFEALQDELCVGSACGACESCARQTFDCAAARQALANECTQVPASVSVSFPVHMASKRAAPATSALTA